MHSLTKWLPYRRPLRAATARLFCFTYAGGSAAAFRAWRDLLAPTIEVCAVEPPGRGTRFLDPPFRRIEHYVEPMSLVIRELADKPFFLFGHSLGAAVAFETAQHLRRSAGPLPVALALSGHGPRDPRELLHTLPTPELIEKLKKLGGTPPEVLDDRELMELVLPVLRADFEATAQHSYEPLTPLAIPILALGGRDDVEVSEESLAAWKEQTTGSFALEIFEGGHFYWQGAEEKLLSTLRRFVEQTLSSRRFG